MSGSQHKKQEKARRKAEREKARQEERRRNLMTGIIVGVVVLIGAVLIVVSVNSGDDPADDETAALISELEASVSAAAAGSEAATEGDAAATATEMVPDDAGVEAGVAVDSGLEPLVDERPVACGAAEPANVRDTRPQFPGGPAQVLEDGVDYVAVVQTSCGEVTFDLLEEDSPETVNSWVFLAQQGFFDGLEIFRNAGSIGALQTGGGDQSNTWSIGYSLPDELGLAQTDGYPVGSVAMANSGPNSGGSQFFFVYNDSFDMAFADAQTFAVFGQVLEGLDILEQIGAIEVDGETPLERVYMDTVEIVEQ